MGDRDWHELFNHLFNEIARRLLCIEDLLSFRMVCQTWREPITFEKKYYQPILSKGIPWLMLTHKESNEMNNKFRRYDVRKTDDNHDATRKFFSLANNKLHSLYLSEACGRRCWGSRYGWLITFGNDLEIHLLNPITCARLPLPPQSTFEKDPLCWGPGGLRQCFFSKAVLGLLPSSTSSDSSYKGQFIVFVLYLFGRLAYARPGDKTWTDIMPSFFIDIAFFNGQIYGIKKSHTEPAGISIDVCDIYNSYPPTSFVDQAPEGINCENKYYLVEMAGELHFVVRGYFYEKVIYTALRKCKPYQKRPLTDHFVVYRLDLCTKEFTELESFEDHALFLGTNSSFSVSVAAHQEFKGNCVYFTDDYYDAIEDYNDVGRDMGVFDYKDKIVKPFYVGPDTISRYCPPTFFTPNLW